MKTVFIDVDTQFDFMYPAGALYVPGAERLVPVIAALNRYAAANGIPIISDTDAHTENDPEFKQWPPHCIAGTLGQKKVPGTLLDSSQQTIIEKQDLDPFSNPEMASLLERLKPDRCVVYGVVTEYCVRLAAMGALKYCSRVEVVTDAIQTLKEEDGRRTLDEFTAAGGHLTTSATYLQSA